MIMSIKLVTKIDLPYILRLEQRGTLETELPQDKDFSQFKIILSPKYISNSDQPVCTSIQIESVLNDYHYDDYPKTSIRSSRVGNLDTLEVRNVIFGIPDVVRKEIFKLVREKLNNFLIFLSESTNMFWIEELPLNPISYVISNHTDFIFLSPETKRVNEDWERIADNFMLDLGLKNIKPINITMTSKYKDTKSTICSKYFNKAHKAIYLSEYEDFCIYCAISAESFIKSLINDSHPSEDENLEKLKLKARSKKGMVETYFKDIMQYLYKTDFSQSNPGLYSNLKSIFELRNNIMHKGFLDKESYLKAGLKELDFEQANKMLSKLEQTFKECKAISQNIE